MHKQFAWVVLAAFLAAPALAANQPQTTSQSEATESRQPKAQRQDQNRWKWWLNPDSRKEIGITDAQSAQIDQIFESMFPAQRAKWREFQRLEEAVSKLLKEHAADVGTVTEQVERMENLEAERRTLRTVMLYRMNLVLTPDQRLKLEAYNKRRDENRRKSERR